MLLTLLKLERLFNISWTVKFTASEMSGLVTTFVEKMAPSARLMGTLCCNSRDTKSLKNLAVVEIDKVSLGTISYPQLLCIKKTECASCFL